MTSLLIYIKHRLPWLWSIAERMNGRLFARLYQTLAQNVDDVLGAYRREDFSFSAITEEDLGALEAFLRRQTSRYLAYFDPHPFDGHTLRRLLNDRAFAMMKITNADDGSFAGYFFLRCFFVGKAFHGLLADERYANRGLGTSMWALSCEICGRTGLRMFATVSEHNAASIASARRATDVAVVERLHNDYMLIECKPRRKDD